MGGSSSSLSPLRTGFLQEIGRRLGCLSTPQYQRQHSVGRKHDFLWILPFHIREPDLGWHSRFFDHSQKTPFFSLDRATHIGELGDSSSPLKNSDKIAEEVRALKISLPLYCTILCAFTRASVGVEVQFDDLLKNPARFNHQEVTVKGIVGGRRR